MKEELENELRELSPFLADLKKQQGNDPYKTPKFYFDNLADKVLAQANSAEKTVSTKQKGTPQYSTLLTRLQGFLSVVSAPRWGMAFASLALVAVVGWWIFTPKTPVTDVQMPEMTVIQPPNAEQILPTVEPTNLAKTPLVASKIVTLKDVPNEEIDAYISDNLADFEGALANQNAAKLAVTEGVKIMHPQSGLTEEELEAYLSENVEDTDLDGSDNNL
jgi:hypothetical protein